MRPETLYTYVQACHWKQFSSLNRHKRTTTDETSLSPTRSTNAQTLSWQKGETQWM